MYSKYILYNLLKNNVITYYIMLLKEKRVHNLLIFLNLLKPLKLL